MRIRNLRFDALGVEGTRGARGGEKAQTRQAPLDHGENDVDFRVVELVEVNPPKQPRFRRNSALS